MGRIPEAVGNDGRLNVLHGRQSAEQGVKICPVEERFASADGEMNLAEGKLAKHPEPLRNRIVVEGVGLRVPRFRTPMEYRHRAVFAAIVAPGSDVPVYSNRVVKVRRQ